MAEYTYLLSDAELARYRAMAAHALAREGPCGPPRALCLVPASLISAAARVRSWPIWPSGPARSGGLSAWMTPKRLCARGALIRQLDLGGRVDIVRRGSRTPACPRVALTWRSCVTCSSIMGPC